jgi:hypothetical protein
MKGASYADISVLWNIIWLNIAPPIYFIAGLILAYIEINKTGFSLPSYVSERPREIIKCYPEMIGTCGTF